MHDVSRNNITDIADIALLVVGFRLPLYVTVARVRIVPTPEILRSTRAIFTNQTVFDTPQRDWSL